MHDILRILRRKTDKPGKISSSNYEPASPLLFNILGVPRINLTTLWLTTIVLSKPRRYHSRTASGFQKKVKIRTNVQCNTTFIFNNFGVKPIRNIDHIHAQRQILFLETGLWKGQDRTGRRPVPRIGASKRRFTSKRKVGRSIEASTFA